MEYYYTKKENVFTDNLLIKGNEAEHLARVLRKTPGEEIYVTDGERNLYKTLILNSVNNAIECRIIERYHNINEPKLRLTLFQSMLKNPGRFEFIIEKATELGAFEVTPIISENVVTKTRDRQERWQNIALAAMKQSQRCYLPKVTSPANYARAIKAAERFGTKIIAHERAENRKVALNEMRKKIHGAVCVFVGPEGGFTEEEIEMARNEDFEVINLGKRKLRSETAALVMVGSLLITSD